MAEAQPENQMEGDQCTIGKIIDKWVRDKREECLDKVNRNKEDFRRKVQNALTELYEAYDIDQLLIVEHDTVKYEDPFFQFAYMYKYVMFSARILSKKVIHDSNVLENLRMQNNITVVCLGGGPGSDVLGVLDYFLKYMGDFRGKLDIQLYDHRSKWGTCWDSLEAAIAAELQDPRVTVNFHDFDVIMNGLQNADVITMHYYMEKVYFQSENPVVKQFFNNIIQTARPGAFFLYSGMYMYQAIDWVHRLLKDNCELLTPDTEQPEQPDMEQPGQPPRQRAYLDTSTDTWKWVPYPKVDLHQEEDLKLFYDIREDLKTEGIPIKKVSQRFEGEVVYRLYKKK